MKLDVFISVAIHVFVMIAALASSPFDPRKDAVNYGEVIQVTLPSADQIPSLSQPEPAAVPAPEPVPAEIPKSIDTDDPDIPISDPITKPAVEIEKPKPKPKPKPPDKKPVQKTPDPVAAEKGQNDQAGESTGEINMQESLGGGATLTGATVDNAAFNYPSWFSLMYRKLKPNFRNPVNYDGKLQCTISFEVIKSGRVYAIDVLESSGIPEFDRACVAAIGRSSPLPPLPLEFTTEIIRINQRFEWEPE